MTRRYVYWGLLAVLLFVPLPLGSVLEWAIFAFEAATVALFVLYLVGELAARRRKWQSPAGDRRAGDIRPGSGLPDDSPEDAGDGDDIPGSAGPAAQPALRLPLAFKVLLGVFLAVSVLQLIPLPAPVVEILSPRAFAICRGLARDTLAGWEARSWLTLSLSPWATAGELALILSYGLFAFLVLRCARTRRRIEILALVMIAAGLFQAFYGMAELFSGHEQIFGLAKRYGAGSVTGTYVNRNHLAGFLEMIFPLSLGYLMVKARYFQMERGMTLREKVLWFGQESLQWTMLFGLASVFIGVGLVFSKSRSGILVFVLTALAAAGAAAGWRGLSGPDPDSEEEAGARRRFSRIVRLVVFVVLAGAVWLGIGPVLERFAQMDISREDRRIFYRNTLEMIGDFPLSGTGKGTYVNAYPMYERVDDRRKLSFAHNDYLEFAAENGALAGASLIAAGIGLAAWLALRWRRRRDNFAKGIGLGALLGVGALLVHGFTDFNLQIPANAVYFVTLIALAMAAVGTGRKTPEPDMGAHRRWDNGGRESGADDSLPLRFGDGINGRTPGPGNMKDSLRGSGSPAGNVSPWGSGLLALGAVGLLVFALTDYVGYHYLARYREARRSVRSVESGFSQLEPLLARAVRFSGRADFRVERARLFMEMARVENESGRDGSDERRDRYCDRAVDSYRAALAANPIDAFAHYETGIAYLLYNYPLMTYADRARAYFRKALEFKPADEFLNVNVLFLYFSWWDVLEPAERAYASSRFRSVSAADPGFRGKLEARWAQAGHPPDRLSALLESGR